MRWVMPFNGGASHHYTVFIPDSVPLKEGVTVHYDLAFQDGPIAGASDYNGLTTEALIAIAIDRLRGFQSGPFACRENALALTKLEEAMMWLHKRTRDRVARGVEGTPTA